jgi:O-methyltransferase
MNAIKIENIIGYCNNPLDDAMVDSVRLLNIYHLLNQTMFFNVAGDVVELGCHNGCSGILIKMIMEFNKTNKKLHLYDSFEGLPDFSEKDKSSRKRDGYFDLGRQDTIMNNFKKYSLGLPIIHKGWFEDTLPTKLPETISFAHLDGDVYSSIKESLEFVYPKMAKNGIIIVDDYDESDSSCFPGCATAVNEFFQDKKEKVIPLSFKKFYRYSCQGIIRNEK